MRSQLPSVWCNYVPREQTGQLGTTGGQAGCRGQGDPKENAPQPCPPLPAALTVFLIEELLHLLPEDHLLPSLLASSSSERKARGAGGPHGLGPQVSPSPTWRSRPALAGTRLSRAARSPAACCWPQPSVHTSIHPSVIHPSTHPHSLNSFPSAGPASGTQHPEEEGGQASSQGLTA